jgi:predicted porin
MKKFLTILLGSVAGLALVGAAQAADLPTKKTPPAPAATNCYASFMTWLDSTAADCPLSYMGLTVYGQVDVGGGYETHASPFNKDFNNGVSELVAKSSNGGKWQWVPNGLSQSNVGIKMKEQVVPNWYIVGDVNLGFDPYSFKLSNGPQSLVDNNGRNTPSVGGLLQSANSDSSRAGQWDNARGYFGVSNSVYGTLTFGRQYAFSNDMASNYDPSGGSYGFSLIGSSGTPIQGLGDTELARYNTSLKYQVTYNMFRAGALWGFGDYSTGDPSNGAYQFDVGFDYAGFSLDAIYSYAKDAVFLSALSSTTIGKYPAYASDLGATIADVESEAIAAKYKNGPWQAFAGYAHDHFASATDSYALDRAKYGFDSIAGIDVPGTNTISGNISTIAYNGKVLQTAWTGAKYSLLSNLDIAGAYYYEWQNNFYLASASTCGAHAKGAYGPEVGAANSYCAGHLEAVSGLVDWRPWKRVDVYGGVMYSQGAGGMVSGWSHDNNTAFTAGVRVSF